MCLDCGCMEPDNRHGDERHIIMQDIVDAAAANKNDVEETFDTIEETITRVFEGDLDSEAWQPEG